MYKYCVFTEHDVRLQILIGIAMKRNAEEKFRTPPCCYFTSTRTALQTVLFCMALKQVQGDSHRTNPQSPSRLRSAAMITFHLSV